MTRRRWPVVPRYTPPTTPIPPFSPVPPIASFIQFYLPFSRSFLYLLFLSACSVPCLFYFPFLFFYSYGMACWFFVGRQALHLFIYFIFGITSRSGKRGRNQPWPLWTVILRQNCSQIVSLFTANVRADRGFLYCIERQHGKWSSELRTNMSSSGNSWIISEAVGWWYVSLSLSLSFLLFNLTWLVNYCYSLVARLLFKCDVNTSTFWN